MVKQVLPHELTEKQIEYYHRAIETDEHSGGLLLVQRGIEEGHLGLFVWKNDQSEMVIITEVVNRPDGFRELLVSMLAGTGGIAQWEEVITTFSDEVAPAFYCDRVITFVKTHLWEKFRGAGAGAGVEELYVVLSRSVP